MILAIDFDGVIHDAKNPLPGRRMGPPMAGAKDTITKLREQGHKVIIHSVWGGGRGGQTIAQWMDYYGIPHDGITSEKPNADKYIDDRAVRFTGWDSVQQQLADGDET